MSEIVNGIKVTSSHRLVHDLVMRWSKNGGFCWATNQSISEKLKLSKSYVSHIITDLHRAGLIGRKITFTNRNEFQCRQLVAFKEAATVEEADAKVEEREAKNKEKAIRKRLTANGRRVGIAPFTVLQAIAHYGSEAVDRALAILRASNTVCNPYAYFAKALSSAWQAGKRASKYVGQTFVGGVKSSGARHIAKNNSAKEADFEKAVISSRIETAERNKVNQGRHEIQDPTLRAMLKKRTGKTYVTC